MLAKSTIRSTEEHEKRCIGFEVAYHQAETKHSLETRFYESQTSWLPIID
jgi:hypothetical protein